MELADLLAREGYSPNDVPALLSWARARASALLQDLDPDSSVGVLLDRKPSGHVPRDMPPPRRRDDDDDVPDDLRLAVTVATSSQPQPAAPQVDDDPDSGLGGFARFQSILKNNRSSRSYSSYRHHEPNDDRPTLARSFALAAERESESRSAAAPSPSSPPRPELSATLPLAAALGISSEESGALVLGIPDDDMPESSGLSGLFDDTGPDFGEPPPSTPRPRVASGFIDDDDEPVRGALVDDDDEAPPVRGALVDDDDEASPVRGALVDDDDEASPVRGALVDDDDEAPPVRGALVDDDDEAPPVLGALVDDDDEASPVRGALVDDDDEASPVRGALVDDDDEDALELAEEPSASPAAASADDPSAEPARSRDTPPMPGLPAVDFEPGSGAPVLRHRTPKKRVVELGAPVAKPPAPGPKAPPKPHPTRKPPPPPPGRRAAAEDDIEELSRVELIDELPPYLRDDDE